MNSTVTTTKAIGREGCVDCHCLIDKGSAKMVIHNNRQYSHMCAPCVAKRFSQMLQSEVADINKMVKDLTK
jgi:hypothetical protein